MVLPLGFIFSMKEPSALIQEQGGPCAIIASVQVTKKGISTEPLPVIHVGLHHSIHAVGCV